MSERPAPPPARSSVRRVTLARSVQSESYTLARRRALMEQVEARRNLVARAKGDKQ